MENSARQGKKGFTVAPEAFIPELTLNRGFYEDVVKGMLAERFPRLKYAAGLLGHCSGCLGFDTVISTDHGWGPRLQIFLTENDHAQLHTQLHHLFAHELPLKYQGFPTNQFQGCWGMEEVDSPPINHWIQIETVRTFFNHDLAWDPGSPPTIHDWLGFTDQGLCELTSGEIFRDDSGDITRARKWLAYYPEEVWAFKMYCLWQAIAEEDAFVGRCNDLGDFIGEMLISGRIAGKLMRLCFLMERQYYPYSKWFGTAFRKLRCAEKLMKAIQAVLTGASHQERSASLCRFCREVGRMHNRLGLTEPVDTAIINFHGRPYRGMDPQPFCEALEPLFGETLHDYDLGLLSKTVLYDESNYGSAKEQIKKVVDGARKQ